MATPNKDLVAGLIASQHPVWVRYNEIWKRNEDYLLGDPTVYKDLKKFIWEEAGDTAGLADREREAVHVNFMEMTAEKFTGVLLEQFGEPDYGKLGDYTDEASDAAMLHRNFDGVGEDARGFDTFWVDTLTLAWATTFRWILMEAPAVAPRNKLDEANGLRPYAVDYSPVATPNWHFVNGELQWVFFRLDQRVVSVTADGKFSDKVEPVYYVLVREGYEQLGEEFKAGGWWYFDAKGEPLVDDAGAPREGRWERTAGRIPVTRLFWSRKKGGDPAPPSSDTARRLSVQHMNLMADLFHDAHTSGTRQIFITVAYEQWKSMVDRKTGEGAASHEESREGGAATSPIYGRIVPIPAMDGVHNQFFDTGSVSASDALLKALEITLGLMTRFLLRELMSAPGESGEARKVMMQDGQSPKLVHLANNLQEAQTAAIRFAEMRWGHSDPEGKCTWNTRFDLRGAIAKIREVMSLMTMGGLTSRTVMTQMFVDALRELGFPFADQENDPLSEATITAELAGGFDRQEQESQFLSTLAS